MKKVRIVLIGIGGFGNQYVNALLTDPRRDMCELVAVCDPRPEGCAQLGMLKAAGIPVYPSPEEMFAHEKADMAVISTPIFLHPAHARLAFENGCNVLLEKPVAANARLTEEIIAAREQSGHELAIGFQWCYDSAMLAFKKDVVSGRFGKLNSMKAMVLWPRDLAYYARGGGWAGKKYAADGTPVFDSVASNATAHYIMNMLFVAGSKIDSAAEFEPEDVRLFRCNDIETFDTIAFKGRIGSSNVTYIASHSITAEDNVDPVFEYTFEKARVTFDKQSGGHIIAVTAQGETIDYGCSYPDGANVEKLWVCASAERDGDWSGIPCKAETALSHSRAMDKINSYEIRDIRAMRVLTENRLNYIPGLGKKLKEAYASGILPEI